MLFVSYNSAGGGRAPRPEIINFFSDRYFPGAPKAEFLKTPVSELKAINGQYQASRREETTKLKLSNLFEQRTAKVDKDGVLTIEDVKDLRGHPIKWKPIGKDLWQAEDDQERIFAIRDSKGQDRSHRCRVSGRSIGTRAVVRGQPIHYPDCGLEPGDFVSGISGGSHSRWEMDLSAKASRALHHSRERSGSRSGHEWRQSSGCCFWVVSPCSLL